MLDDRDLDDPNTTILALEKENEALQDRVGELTERCEHYDTLLADLRHDLDQMADMIRWFKA